MHIVVSHTLAIRFYENRSGYGFGELSITCRSKELESAESCGEQGEEVSPKHSRRSADRGRKRESLRGESLAKCRENRGQKREQADVLRRRPDVRDFSRSEKRQ